jgi:mannose-6-phosphate isomerase-like protein (cupin superfamily)
VPKIDRGRGVKLMAKLYRCHAIVSLMLKIHRSPWEDSTFPTSSLYGRGMSIINREELPFVGMSHEFVGEKHGVNISFFLVNAPPGRGPRLHRHNYDEVIVVQEGRAAVTAGNEQHEVKAGDIVVIPAGTPHKFVNSGDTPLRQIDIHASSDFVNVWIAGEDRKTHDETTAPNDLFRRSP